MAVCPRLSSVVLTVALFAPLLACSSDPGSGDDADDGSQNPPGGAAGSGSPGQPVAGNGSVMGGTGSGGASQPGGSGTSAGGMAGTSAGGTNVGGTSSAGGSGGSGGVVEPLPGVVVVDTSKGTKSCVALCRANTNPALDPEMDDWSFEAGQSCVIPGTTTGRNQMCTTGEPLPPPPSVPGVVVVETGASRCAPLCTITTNVANDPDRDGWSYENNSSCVIPGTVTASNQSCMTGQPLPAPAPRPGILVDTDGDGDGDCVPLCRVVMQASDPKAPDWGFENNASCVLPASPTATGRLTCTFAGAPRVFRPPALTGTKMQDGFYVQAGKLHDPYGAPFVIRGVNNAHIYFDTSARYLAWQALDNIASYGTNTIRVVWDTTGSAALLAEVLYRVVELKMVPMVELHDVTGNQDAARLLDMAEYYTRADVKQVLIDFREYLLVNIANEWSGQGNYASAYQAAISHLRTNGIEHLLVIDGSGFGQNANSIFDNAAALTSADPERNLLFSVHMYGQYGSASAVDTVLNRASMSQIPLIVGEFGHVLSGSPVAWQAILTRAQALGIGTIAWSWMGNDAMNAPLNMAQAWEGPLTQWGRDVLTSASGIQATSRRASIFN